MENMIKITGVDLVKFAKKVYELSNPQGLGFLHYQEGGLDDAEAEGLVDSFKPKGFDKPHKIALSMDYVRGRACKMVVFRDGEDLYIRPTWYDHSEDQYKKLLSEFGIK